MATNIKTVLPKDKPVYKTKGFSNVDFSNVHNVTPSTVVNTVTNPSTVSDPSSSSTLLEDLTREFNNMYDKVYDLSQENNARMVENAERQMAFQEQSQAKTMQFNAEQAKLDRDWQEYMSNTAHQREVSDLIASGLNPVLSANGGAPVGSGASASAAAMSGSQADVDTSVTNFAGNMLGAIASMHNAEVSAKAALGAASINAAAQKSIMQMQLDQPGTMWATINKLLNAGASGYSAKAVSWTDLIKMGISGLFK